MDLLFWPKRRRRAPRIGAQPCFACSAEAEPLALELARLVDGTCELMPGVAGIMILANNATVPRSLPGPASEEAVAWWHTSVSTTLGDGPTSRSRRRAREARVTT